MGNEIKRDLSIDFVKGIAALFVVLLHSMPNNYTWRDRSMLGQHGRHKTVPKSAF